MKNVQSRDEILYIYDRVCTREAKERQILREYGGLDPMTDNPSRERTYDSPALRARQAERRPPADRDPSRPRTSSHPGTRRAASRPRSSDSWQYRPGDPEGGEAVRTGKLRAAADAFMDWVLSFFDAQESGAEASMRAAKHLAAVEKRLREHRHVILTVLILLVLSAVIAFGAYKVFFVVEGVTVSGSETYGEDQIVKAAGILAGENLYSFSASDAEGEITFLCPYIRSATVKRTVPTSVSITLEDDAAVYYANIWGDTLLLSEGLRVLEAVDADSPRTEGLIELVLPPVDKSVAGRVLEFTSPRAERYIRSVLGQVAASPLRENGMVDRIELTDEYEISMKACGIYSLICGGEADMNLKMKMAYVTITSGKLDSEIRATINLKEVGEAVAMYDFSESGD